VLGKVLGLRVGSCGRHSANQSTLQLYRYQTTLQPKSCLIGAFEERRSQMKAFGGYQIVLLAHVVLRSCWRACLIEAFEERRSQKEV
jgi:hypothetical protein